MMVLSAAGHYVNASYPRPWKVLYYPKRTMFRKADLIDKGCIVFLNDCPKVYKQLIICARHYDGVYKTFNNYCEMEYENCNGWRSKSFTLENLEMLATVDNFTVEYRTGQE
ncbi:unnamed protein product [Arctia plantaginis]|uniref:Kazal-like domain-containing protein n=1 Tax=Arctia plantaginis TaxID=874455 RepID=A0A8S0YT99_ARCPL|nr:unnamed protein product [Arctia plantaginis]